MPRSAAQEATSPPTPPGEAPHRHRPMAIAWAFQMHPQCSRSLLSLSMVRAGRPKYKTEQSRGPEHRQGLPLWPAGVLVARLGLLVLSLLPLLAPPQLSLFSRGQAERYPRTFAWAASGTPVVEAQVPLVSVAGEGREMPEYSNHFTLREIPF